MGYLNIQSAAVAQSLPHDMSVEIKAMLIWKYQASEIHL